mmetsp:Transcript_10661/g.13944  ORF Transcript_10661/g.13944 Transcript_10661/m.13944 type:complete len:83 (+) Transcript_10661:138-386(+)
MPEELLFLEILETFLLPIHIFQEFGEIIVWTTIVSKIELGSTANKSDKCCSFYPLESLTVTLKTPPSSSFSKGNTEIVTPNN